MIYFRNACTAAALFVILATFFLQLPSNDAKIAYKKPIYDKLYYAKNYGSYGSYGGYYGKKQLTKPTKATITSTTTMKPLPTTAADLDDSLQQPSEISETFIAKHDYLNESIDDLASNEQHLVKIIDEDDNKNNENILKVDNSKDIENVEVAAAAPTAGTTENNGNVEMKENAEDDSRIAIMDIPLAQSAVSTTAPNIITATTVATTTVAPVPTTTTTKTTKTPTANAQPPKVVAKKTATPCTCGVFLSSQIPAVGLAAQPTEEPVIKNELDRVFQCNPIGQKQCQTKCLEAIVQHLPNSASILCATLNRDCRKERAYLFIKNCRDEWINTTLTAGREYCCKNGQPYSCPLV